MGSRRIVEVWSGEYSPAAEPSSTLAAPAKNDVLSTVPGTSKPDDSRIGLPVCAVSTAASSSAAAPMSPASRCSRVDRSPGVVRDQAGNAARAAPTARPTSTAVASRKLRSAVPVAGSRMSNGSPEPSTASPPMTDNAALASSTSLVNSGAPGASPTDQPADAHQGQRDHQHQRADDVDLWRQGPLIGTPDEHREGDLGTGVEVRDDEVIEGQ